MSPVNYDYEETLQEKEARAHRAEVARRERAALWVQFACAAHSRPTANVGSAALAADEMLDEYDKRWGATDIRGGK